MFIVSLWYHGWEKNAMESEENFPKSCGSRQIDEREKSCYDTHQIDRGAKTTTHLLAGGRGGDGKAILPNWPRQACRAGGLAEKIRKTVCNPMQECYLDVLCKTGAASLSRGKSASYCIRSGRGAPLSRPFCFVPKGDDMPFPAHIMTKRAGKI